MTTMRRWRFTVRRDHESPLKEIEVVAPDSFGAVDALPDDVVFWDFAQFEDGSYSMPADDERAA